MGDNFDLLKGFWLTIKLSVLSGVLSLVWGWSWRCCGSCQARPLAPVRWLTIAYIDAFRGVPLLLVLLLVSGGSARSPRQAAT